MIARVDLDAAWRTGSHNGTRSGADVPHRAVEAARTGGRPDRLDDLGEL
ncbi:hypothetical protein [Parasphingorhabdus pacifica]